MKPIGDAEFAEIVRHELHEVGDALSISMRIGITGSRNVPTDKQEFSLGIIMNTLARDQSGPVELHHGMCVGTDECAHYIGAVIPRMSIIGHPGYGKNKQSPYRMKAGHDFFSLVLPALPYAERNRAIVEVSGVILACPEYPEHDPRSLRSGTWQTIRIAKRAHIPVIVIPPSGVIVHAHGSHGEE